MASELFEKGLKNRKEVLGAAHVERSLAGADDFTRPYQELVTEYCWGAVWGRPGLPRKTRSLLNLAMLTALNREEEFKLHVRAAFHNGVTKEEKADIMGEGSYVSPRERASRPTIRSPWPDRQACRLAALPASKVSPARTSCAGVRGIPRTLLRRPA